jgi:peptidoglycan-associated lipoprotein
MIAGSLRFLRSSGFVFILTLIPWAMSACGTAQKATSESATEETASVAEDASQQHSDTGHAMGLRTVLFPFKTSDITPEAEAVVAANADVLTKNPSITIQIEGHCDDRGGVERNFELGQSRAEAIQKRLRALGIASRRMSVISYGKGRPVDTGESEEARAKNRRAAFLITSK